MLLSNLHQARRDEVVSSFHAYQAMSVRQLGREFEQYMRARAQGVHVLSSFASVQHRDMKKMAADIQEYFAYVEERLC